jgi:hypothetical protein
MNDPQAHFVRLPPWGMQASLGAARREARMNDPQAHFVRLPPWGMQASLGAARREA